MGTHATDRYLVISADAHAGLPAEEYRAYLDPQHHAAFDEFLAERRARREELLSMNFEYIMGWETDNAEGLRGAFDAEQRDKELDADGVAGEVIFPDADAITGMAGPPFGAGLSAGEITDAEHAFAGAHAHNRFLVDLCAHSPERRGGVGLVPITHDPERAVGEIEWLAQQPGIRGIMIPTMWRDHPPYNHPQYDRVWAACQAAALPVHTHSGEAPQEEYGEHIGIYLAEVAWWTHRPMWHLLFSGAFERFPDLKFVVTEAAAYWAADMMWKWDQYMGGGHTTKKMAKLLEGKISKLPSEYFGTNLFIGASTMSREEIRRRHVIGCDVIMWGTDYPHPEGTWPHTIERLRTDFAGVPVEDARQLLGETAARCYSFDLDALRPIADRIGPTPDDLGQDPAWRSDPDEVRAAQWWKDEYGLR
jgi:predicted TIM-barrel fold metal-dependent hydrolase